MNPEMKRWTDKFLNSEIAEIIKIDLECPYDTGTDFQGGCNSSFFGIVFHFRPQGHNRGDTPKINGQTHTFEIRCACWGPMCISLWDLHAHR